MLWRFENAPFKVDATSFEYRLNISALSLKVLEIVWKIIISLPFSSRPAFFARGFCRLWKWVFRFTLHTSGNVACEILYVMYLQGLYWEGMGWKNTSFTWYGAVAYTLHICTIAHTWSQVLIYIIWAKYQLDWFIRRWWPLSIAKSWPHLTNSTIHCRSGKLIRITCTLTNDTERRRRFRSHGYPLHKLIAELPSVTVNYTLCYEVIASTSMRRCSHERDRPLTYAGENCPLRPVNLFIDGTIAWELVKRHVTAISAVF